WSITLRFFYLRNKAKIVEPLSLSGIWRDHYKTTIVLMSVYQGNRRGRCLFFLCSTICRVLGFSSDARDSCWYLSASLGLFLV
ncbi:hypothetical protein TorRG33x02_038640, partial [Trema orientale]